MVTDKTFTGRKKQARSSRSEQNAAARSRWLEQAGTRATEPFPEDLLKQFRQGAKRHGEDQSYASPSDAMASFPIEQPGFRPAWLDYNPVALNAPLIESRTLFDFIVGRLWPRTLQTRRVELLDRAYPWCAIGRVYSGIGPDVHNNGVEFGTGVLIGRDLLLTCSHLAPWGRQPGDWWMGFVPGARDAEEPFGRSYVRRFRGIPNDDGVNGRDYLIAQLYQPLGDLCGWLGWQYWGDDDEYKRHAYQSVGYPGNVGSHRPILEPLVFIDDVDGAGDGRELETDVFTSKGWSGGPLFTQIEGGPRVVGVCSGEETEFSFWDFFWKKHSVFAGGKGMGQLIRYAQANW